MHMKDSNNTKEGMTKFDSFIYWITHAEGIFFVLTLTLMAIVVSDIMNTVKLVSEQKTAYIKEHQCETIALPNSSQSGYRCIVNDKEEYMHEKQVTEIAKNKVRNRETPAKA